MLVQATRTSAQTGFGEFSASSDSVSRKGCEQTPPPPAKTPGPDSKNIKYKTACGAASAAACTKTKGAACTKTDCAVCTKICDTACVSAPCKIPRIALKTNLLFDLAGAPNIGAEYLFAIPGVFGGERRFSVAVDFAFASWRSKNLYALQTVQGGAGVKYRFNQRRGAFTGWSVGVYGIYSGPWDVQWKDGWQGDSFVTTGISGGYATPIGKSLNLEFLLAAGYFFTPEARHYHRPERGYLMWQQTRRNTGRFAPTRAQINLVWLINGKKKSR